MTKDPSKGFTLIELLVAMTLFALVVAAMTGTAFSIIKSQRKAFALQSVQESARFMLEAIAKEIRMSTIISPDSGGSPVNFLSIKAYKEGGVVQDVDYRFTGTQLQRRINGGSWQDVNPSNLDVSGSFYIRKSAAFHRAAVTFVMRLSSKGTKTEEQAEIYFQSTVSSRQWDN